MRFARLSPSPQPRFLVVKPGRKTLPMSFLRMPLPVSVTSRMAFVSVSSTWIVMVPCPPPMASTAFLQRFSITHSKSDALRLTTMSSLGSSLTMLTLREVLRSM